MKRILVVEENRDVLENIAEILIMSNYHVIKALNGKEGIEKAQEYMPDLIVSNITMPVIDGLALLHVLRQDPKTERVPIIFLTALTENSRFRHAMQSGADDYISTPFHVSDLLKTIEYRLKRKEILERSINTGAEGNIDGLHELENEVNFEMLIKICDSIHYEKRHVIYKENQMPHFLYYIQKGKVRTYKTHNNGKQLVVGLYNQGDFFGHIALLEDGPYKEIAETMEDTQVVLIPKKSFEDLMHKNVAVANKFLQLLAKRVSENEQQLLNIAYDTLREKVANALVHLHNKFNANNDASFYIDISRNELAAIAGTATESVVRTLSDFKAERLIDIKKDNKIQILNIKKIAGLYA